jgi:hypothetical protein
VLDRSAAHEASPEKNDAEHEQLLREHQRRADWISVGRPDEYRQGRPAKAGWNG